MGAGDVGPVQPGYESGDTGAMLNAFKRDTHRALADWVGDREPWPGWFGQGLQAMLPNLRGYQAYEADRTSWVLQQPGGAERLEAATVRRLQRHADPAGARRLARECPVTTASDLIRDPAERRRLDQSIAEGGRGRTIKVASMAAASQSTPSQPESQESARAPLLQWMEDWGAEGPDEGRKGREGACRSMQERLEGKESLATGQWCSRGRSRERL